MCKVKVNKTPKKSVMCVGNLDWAKDIIDTGQDKT